MLPTSHLLAFTLTTVVFIAIPGPSVLFVVSRSVVHGSAAGVATVAGNTAGMITRIGLQPWTEGAAVARVRRDGVWCEQLPVAYDQAQWLSLFEQWWPAGSAAHLSYFRRIAEGV